jgi:5-methylcytosine-specific restriction endonuclease McrA
MQRRPPNEVWRVLRRKVWERDRGRCKHCGREVSLREAHIDHINTAPGVAGNGIGNLRTLCRACHVLREDNTHRGMIAAALRDGIIPPDWRSRVWRG